MRFPRGRLLVFAKAPVPGRVKTRLVPALGEQGAADLHRFLVDDTLCRTVRADICPAQLWCAPDCEHPIFRDWQQRFGVELRRQEGADIGGRMHHALALALDTADYAVLVGTDCPELDADDVAGALGCLDAGCDAVFVPAEDGGYVLIGLRRSEACVFAGVDWGGPRVMEQTRERLRTLGWRWRELPARWDVDRPEDLDRLARLQGAAAIREL